MNIKPTDTQTKNYWWFFLIVVVLVAAITIFFIHRAQNPEKPVTPDPAFAAYVSGYTGGVISKTHSIIIKLAKPLIKKVQAGDELEDGVLSFSPAIAGKAYWQDTRTLEFRPSAAMESGEVYKATLQLDRLVKIDDPQFDDFIFGFQIIPQSFEVQEGDLLAEGRQGLQQYTYEGKVITADEADNKEIEKMIRATYAGKQQAIIWKHDSKTSHTFLIKNIQRGSKEQMLKLNWSGKALGLNNKKGEKYVPVPAKGSFKILNAKVEEGNEPAVHLFFSDPLDENQLFDGLLKIDTIQEMTHVVKGNELTLYPGQPITGPQELDIYQGIKNINRQALMKDNSLHLVFQGLKPAVKFVGQGNILPSTDGLILPIEAVNLKTVELRVIKIYQDRVGQFFQVNDLDGSDQLTRVGRPVLRKLIHLDNMGVADLGKWHRFTLELSKLINTEPGAIYQIALGFTKKDVALACPGEEEDNGMEKVDDPREHKKEEAFDDPGSYFYDDFAQYYDEDYDWQQRDNPCNSAYYSGDKNVIKKNILASDIGLMAKRGTDNNLLLIATDLKTAEPLAGVTLNIFNYQLQKIATTSTDDKGLAQLNMPDKAFLVEAEHKKQRAYLKLTDGSALSVSQFDVSGSHVQQGIKGFLYGERGVWRPGDSIYLSFMLEDKNHKLPAHDPVVFELTNPRGMLAKRMVKSSSTGGIYAFSTATSADAPTGNWTAQVKVGGATFTKNIKIETVKPNRLKIDLHFKDDKITPDQQSGTLHVRWLSGAIAGNLRADYEMILTEAHTTFKGYSQYQFDDPASDFQTVDKTIFQGQLDAEGNADIHPAIKLDKHAPSSLNAFFKGKVYEPGGNFSVNYQSVPYYTYQHYIGIKVPQGSGYGDMLDLDKPYTIDVATVNTAGKPVDMDSLQVQVFKTRWRWWWEENDNKGADFVNSKYYQQVLQKTISTGQVKGHFGLQIASPKWGRYYIRISDPKSGYTTGAFVYFEWPENEGSTLAGMPGGATRLTFTPDKQVYKVGEKMKLYIPGSGEGNVFISLENGSRVIRTYWMKEKKGTNVFTIPVTADMTPNIYINVSEIQPHGQTVNDLPIRQYGIVGVKVEDPSTVLQPEITMPDKLRPNQKVNISVKEKSGKPMAYTIAVVDEGLLDLTNYKTPNPWDVFYAREALGVKTWDVYDQVIGAYGARLERLLSIGGGGEVQENPQSQNLRFKPVVKFFGPYYLAKGQSATHSFVMPNYVGEVRAMVVAGYDGAYGLAEKSVKVKQPLMILSTLPRVAGPEEEISLPVNIFAMEKGVKDVTLKVSTDHHFDIEGGAIKHIHFDQTGDSLVEFKLKVNALTGEGKVHVVASGDGFQSANDIDLAVRNPNLPQTQVLTKVLQVGESWKPDIHLFGLKGTNAIQLEVSSVPPLNLGKRLAYLIDYPYGCVEQTVSTVFPQLYLDKLIPLSDEQQKDIAGNIKAGISQLMSFQHASGGFTYWPGSNYPDDWATSYAGHFLLEARKKGYAVMNGMISKWTAYQTRRANLWQPQHDHQDELIQAYRLYTLALARQPDWSAMNRMRELQQLSLQARWRLADAYAAAGQTDVARQLTNQASLKVPDYRSMAYTYGSGTRDEAMILQTLSDLGEQQKGYLLAKSISNTLNSGDWMSTQETAYSLIALSEFFSHNKTASEINYTYQVDNKGAQAEQTKLPESQVDIPVTDQRAPTLTLQNKAQGVLYANVVIKGTPAAGNEVAVQHQLQMQVRYIDYNGNEINPAELKQGTDFIAEVTIHNPGLAQDYKNMALAQVFPSGWEIRNTRFEGTAGIYNVSTPDYQDIRDDRVYTYFDLGKGKTKQFRILLSATYAGKYYLPEVKCSAMYDNSIIAVKPGEWVKVNKR